MTWMYGLKRGHDGACKKVVNAVVKGGVLKIDFPEVKAGASSDLWHCDSFGRFCGACC